MAKADATIRVIVEEKGPEFKVGDVVRINDAAIKDDEWYKDFRKRCPQEIFTVRRIRDDAINLEGDDYGYIFDSRWLERVPFPKEMYAKQVKEITAKYIKDHVELSKYKEDDLNQMVEDLWFALFNDAVSEVAGNALAEYYENRSEEKDNG